MKKTQEKQLWLNFNRAVQQFEQSGAELVAASKALREKHPEAAPEMDEAMVSMRKRLNRMVLIHARHKGLHWREVWRILYSRLREQTGFDPFIRGLAEAVAPIEAVCRHGKLPSLFRIAANF